jgi:hypothetical protein
MPRRRDLFKHLLGHLYVLKEEAIGHRHFKLADLWTFDDATFSHLKFRVRADVAIYTDENAIYGIKNDDEKIFLCAVGTDQETMFRFMQQRLTIGEMAQRLSSAQDQSPESRFREVREFMLSLVERSICVPANAGHLKPENNQKEEDV